MVEVADMEEEEAGEAVLARQVGLFSPKPLNYKRVALLVLILASQRGPRERARQGMGTAT